MSDLADRVRRVRLLLETLNDPYPTPRSALRSDSGPAASRYVPCETCRRTGWVRRRKTTVLCLACDGHGWRRRQHDEQAWDAYIGLPVTEAAGLPVEPPPTQLLDPATSESTFAWERLRASYDRRGSYRELRAQLDRLAHAQPRRHRLVRTVLVEQLDRRLTRTDQLELELGVVTIALRMRTVRVPPWLLEHEQQTTNLSIRALAAAGYKPAQIAARLGVSGELVKRTLRRHRQRGAVRSGVYDLGRRMAPAGAGAEP